MGRHMNSSEDTLEIIHEVFAAFDAHDLDHFRSLLTPKTVMQDASGQIVKGPDAIISAVSMMLDAFPELRVSVTNAFADGLRGVAEVMREGIHSGPLRLPSGEVPPTGKRLRLPETVVFEIQNGKISSMRVYTDQLTGMIQLGLFAP